MEDKRPTPYPLRMPTGMRQALESYARTNGRSLNAEILARLEFTFEIEDELPRWEEQYGISAVSGFYDSLIPIFEKMAAKVADIEAGGMGSFDMRDQLEKIQQDLADIKKRL